MDSHFTREQRDAWYATTKESPFNLWLEAEVKDAHGQLDLERLHAVALRFGIDKRAQYAHLNVGQQRMNIGNMLRRIVPQSVYASYERPGTIAPVPSKAVSPSRPLIPPGLPNRSPPSESGSLEHRLIRASSVRELLATYGAIMDELREREIVRTGNAPGGDYAEVLFARAFGWSLEANSATGYDAVDASGARYQIKSRRLASPNSSRQLSALRKLPERSFDFLAGVLFASDYGVLKAVILPHESVSTRARFVAHTNAWTFLLDDSVWALPGARDVTAELRVAAEGF